MSKRRGSNEGSIYKRLDGRWTASLTLGYEDGKRSRKAFYGASRREVAEKLAVALRDVQQGLPMSPERLTFGSFISRWMEESARPTLRPLTFRSYDSIVKEHLVPEFGRTRLAKLSPADVQRYINQKLAAGLSPYTVRNHHALLRRVLNQAVRWGLLARNPATVVSAPRIEHEEVHPLSPVEARAFLAAVTGDRLSALYVVTIALGLRQGETLGLAWADLDLDEGILTVRKALQRVDGAYALGEPKTRRSRRTIAVPAEIVAQLRAHRARQLAERLRAGELWGGDRWGLVFMTETGQPMSGAVVTHRFQAVLKKAGLPRQRFHDLRHAAASFMLAQGVPMRVVMDVLGHSEIAVTANLYSHVMPELQRDATNRTATLLWGAS
jgi:integrase